MGSKTSKAKRIASVDTKTVAAPVVPRVPQEIVDEIMDHLATDSDSRSLRSCSLVSKSWVPSCQRHLFHTILFTSRDTERWVKKFPLPEQSPAHHVRDLGFSLGGYHERFFEHIPWFRNVKKMTLLEHGFQSRWISSFGTPGRLPQCATSLILTADTVTLLQIRDVMMQLPNLNDLSLSGSFVVTDRNTLRGIGTVLRGKFGGQLQLLRRHANADIMNMLLEVPTGLHFTEVHIRPINESLLSTVRLAEACDKTLVKLTYAVAIHDGREACDRSFDFSEFPSLQEVNFGVCWIGGGLRWIPMALLTLKPATSPRLSAVRLNFISPLSDIRSAETSAGELGNDLQRTADEVTRIRREFGGAVNVIVLRDPWFKVAFDTLQIFQH
ncbi:hypothetical protein BDM02DRAFT_3119985 [Thelephora ganbajun]|uniref:Uncharacterized protein n=1 Tax=Thelephora ganbajun TaxID=370292 RepID=A0ACB6Z7P2_THEGA|nr:hypothetical protein BDM02DRAFT_3119985 [Thelephora ganbajun]